MLPLQAKLSRYRWRTVDLVTVAVLGSAFGIVYWAWNQIWAITTPLFVAFPPTQASLYGVWMLPQVIAVLIIRRPGAALFASLAAVIVSTLLGNAFGLTMLFYGVAQGLAVELVFAVTRYRRFGWPLAGLGTALACAAGTSLDTVLYYPFWDQQWKTAYIACGVVGGFVLGALVAPFVVRRLRRAEVLGDFAGSNSGGRQFVGVDPAALDLKPGERVLITGRSGSGKSTLLSALAANAPGEAVGGLTLLQQDPEANILMSRIGDDVAFGLENACVPRAQIWPAVATALDQVGLPYELQRSTAQLSGGEKQRLGLAGSIAPGLGMASADAGAVPTAGARLVLLDEPTANLDPAGAREAIAAVDQYVRTSGATLVVVDHNVELVQGIVDRMIVIADGRIILDGDLPELLREHPDELAAAGVFVPGAPFELTAPVLTPKPPKASPNPSALSQPPAPQHSNSHAPPALAQPTSPTPVSTPAGEIVLTARSLTVARGTPPQLVLNGLDLDIRRGELVAICGVNGAGKSTLARALGGLLKPTSGEVLLAGEPRPMHKLRAPELASQVVSVFQEPEHQFLTDSVRAELTVGLPRTDATNERAQHVLKLLSLDQLAQANPFAISGGEKRRLALAVAFMHQPKVLILDEPTFGQDAATWRSITQEVIKLAASGIAVVAVTHDEAFVRATGAREIQLAKVATQRRGGAL